MPILICGGGYNMPAAKKIGSANDFIPSGEEIMAIYKFLESILDRYPDITSRSLSYKTIDSHKPPKSKLNSESILTMEKEIRLLLLGWPQNCDKAKIYSYWNLFKTPKKLTKLVQEKVSLSEEEPVELSFIGFYGQWIFKGFRYKTDGLYSNQQFKLLVFDEFDKERRKFERLKGKFQSPESVEASRSRPRLPESVRIEVWRRDGGKCAKCGSRENLEYDHIVPVSKGGSNTTRNIELLCESCNRSKGSNIG